MTSTMMAQNRRQSIRLVDVPSLELLQEGGDRRKSMYPVGASRRSSSIQSSHIATVLTSKKLNRKIGRADTASRPVCYEPTYRMEPSIKFHVPSVRTVIQETLKELLDGCEYDPLTCSSLNRTVAEEVKERVKQMGYERYKIVVAVVIGEKKDQGIMVTSRCAWEPKFDDFATCTFQNKSIFCSAQVFGMYLD